MEKVAVRLRWTLQVGPATPWLRAFRLRAARYAETSRNFRLRAMRFAETGRRYGAGAHLRRGAAVRCWKRGVTDMALGAAGQATTQAPQPMQRAGFM